MGVHTLDTVKKATDSWYEGTVEIRVLVLVR